MRSNNSIGPVLQSLLKSKRQRRDLRVIRCTLRSYFCRISVQSEWMLTEKRTEWSYKRYERSPLIFTRWLIKPLAGADGIIVQKPRQLEI